MANSALSYRHPSTGEWAHDHRDPLAEARTAFVAPALEARPPVAGRTHRLLEVGFGRGLNTAIALRTLADSPWQGPIEAFGMEPFPERLQPWPECPAELADFAPWWGVGTGHWQIPNLDLQATVCQQTAETALATLSKPVDWIFLDLFSPGRHPLDWPPSLYTQLAKVAAYGAALTSYCCARVVRDGLQTAGWEVQVRRQDGYRDTLLARWFAQPASRP